MPRLATLQVAVGVGVLVVGLAFAAGATTIAAEAGYSGVGPNFLPWLVAVFLTVCARCYARR
jgi:putative tricarboxylic transport membrane protein